LHRVAAGIHVEHRLPAHHIIGGEERAVSTGAGVMHVLHAVAVGIKADEEEIALI
jgi:hypothetical protein